MPGTPCRITTTMATYRLAAMPHRYPPLMRQFCTTKHQHVNTPNTATLVAEESLCSDQRNPQEGPAKTLLGCKGGTWRGSQRPGWSPCPHPWKRLCTPCTAVSVAGQRAGAGLIIIACSSLFSCLLYGSETAGDTICFSNSKSSTPKEQAANGH